MQLFINDLPIKITNFTQRPDFKDFDIMIDAERQPIDIDILHGEVLILASEETQVIKFIKAIEVATSLKITQMVIVTNKKKALKDALKGHFKIINAAGGIVEHNDKYLLIHRNERWDLPKGKVEKNEADKDAAVREIEEECNVKSVILKKIAITWHNYHEKGQSVLKKTTWYAMKAKHKNVSPKPQQKEGIEQATFFDKKNARRLLANSFQSIQYVIEQL